MRPMVYRASERPMPERRRAERLCDSSSGAPQSWYDLTAPIFLDNCESGRCLQATVQDLSRYGCRVITNEPFPVGSQVRAIITRDGTLCDFQARVVSSQNDSGMSLLFTEIESESLQIVSKWIKDANQSAWLCPNRRRSRRLFASVPLRIFKQNRDGTPVMEDTETLTISAHGALLVLEGASKKGELLSSLNMETGAAAECMIVYIGEQRGSQKEVGIEFLLPNPSFWKLAFGESMY